MGKPSDLTGKTFGRLQVVGPVEKPEGGIGNDYWRCMCSCGKEIFVRGYSLRSGKKKSCGCMSAHDLTGQHIDQLTVLRRSECYAPRGRRRVPLWECLCDCGAITYKATDTLTSTRRCSCAACADKQNAQHARDNGGYVEGTQIAKIRNIDLKSNNISGVRGVYPVKGKQCWEAMIKFQGKRKRLGYFADLEDAKKARQRAEEDIFGEFCRKYDEMNATAAASDGRETGMILKESDGNLIST